MSAYIVDKNHIDYLLEAAIALGKRGHGIGFSWYHGKTRYSLDPFSDASMTGAGQMLWDENVKSVKARYGDPDEGLPGPIGCDYKYTYTAPCYAEIDPVQVLKACHCYAYQSCEHSEWEGSGAWAFVQALQECAGHSMPTYRDCVWGAPEPQANTVNLTRLRVKKGL